MAFSRHTHRASNRTLAVLLMLCLLTVQSLGLLHGVLHAGGKDSALARTTVYMTHGLAGASQSGRLAPIATPATPATLAILDRLVGGDDAGTLHGHHSCANFDAATVPAMLHSAAFALPILENRHCLAIWLAFSSWMAPFHPNFSSRAPPLD